MRICVGITGSIAAYRSVDFVKELTRKGHEVSVVLTDSASELVSSRVLSTFTRRPVLSSDAFGADHSGTDHIETARWAEVFVIYGATANFLARYAHGICDDFLNLQLIATAAPVLVAPAMNPTMWLHPSVQENLEKLRSRGVHFIDPIPGRVACGEVGVGHIAEISEIVDAVSSLASEADLFLKGRKILISAGPMRTSIDPVRFIQNQSSGLMGLEIARAARNAGAEVTVLLGPVEVAVQEQFEPFAVTSYTTPEDYGDKLLNLFEKCDAFLSVAAVLDFEVIPNPTKIERRTLETQSEMRLPMRAVPDFVARMASLRKPHQKVIAFAAETGSVEEIIQRARQKMEKKKVHAIVANPVWPNLGPGALDNQLWVIRPGKDTVPMGPALKFALAHPLLKLLFSENA